MPQEYDTLKLSQRKCSGQQSAMDVRLNRAVEEAEKYKVALQGARSEAKVRRVFVVNPQVAVSNHV